MDLSQHIRNIPDFPKPGILFKDITPLLSHPAAFQETIRRLVDHYRPIKLDAIVAAEARGFIFAAPMAIELGIPFVPIRKPGKLPYEKLSYDYALEYGTDRLEIHVDGVAAGARVLVVDDLLATGGTVEACCKLIEKCGGQVVGCAFVVELAFLNGAERLKPHPVFSVMKYA